MFIVHVHCSLFMFIVHCSHGATLIFDDVFFTHSDSTFHVKPKLVNTSKPSSTNHFILQSHDNDSQICDSGISSGSCHSVCHPRMLWFVQFHQHQQSSVIIGHHYFHVSNHHDDASHQKVCSPWPIFPSPGAGRLLLER